VLSTSNLASFVTPLIKLHWTNAVDRCLLWLEFRSVVFHIKSVTVRFYCLSFFHTDSRFAHDVAQRRRHPCVQRPQTQDRFVLSVTWTVNGVEPERSASTAPPSRETILADCEIDKMHGLLLFICLFLDITFDLQGEHYQPRDVARMCFSVAEIAKTESFWIRLRLTDSKINQF